MAPSPTLPKNVSVAEAGDDGRLHAPAAARNAEAITAVLKRFAPQEGNALEIASGTGQHVAGFARAMPHLSWQPTEIVQARRDSIDLWTRGHDNVRAALTLDATQPGWGSSHAGQNLIVVINLLHLIPAAAVRSMIAEVSRALAPAGRVVMYGPFLRDGVATSDGDARFDASLRASDPAIGYKDLDTVRQWLAHAGLAVLETVDMPANNLTLIAEKKEASS